MCPICICNCMPSHAHLCTQMSCEPMGCHVMSICIYKCMQKVISICVLKYDARPCPFAYPISCQGHAHLHIQYGYIRPCTFFWMGNHANLHMDGMVSPFCTFNRVPCHVKSCSTYMQTFMPSYGRSCTFDMVVMPWAMRMNICKT